jgi:sporulation protein YlmC with PRC-barrel domain
MKRESIAASTERGADIVGKPKKTSISAGPGPEIMAAQTLIHNEVYNMEGEKLGKIEEIMLDIPAGRIAYAVLESTTWLGLNIKLFALPWQVLTLDTDRKCFLMDVSKERLKREPGFDKGQWPAMADQRWAQDLYERFNVAPYWS